MLILFESAPNPIWAGLGPEAGEDPRWWPVHLVRGPFQRVPEEGLEGLEILAGPRWDGRIRVVSHRGRLWVLPPLRFPAPPAPKEEKSWEWGEEGAQALHRWEEALLSGSRSLEGLTEQAANALAFMATTTGAFLPVPLMEALGLPPARQVSPRLALQPAERLRAHLPAWWGDPETSAVHHLALAARATGSALEVRMILRTLLPDPPGRFRELLQEFALSWGQ